MLSMGQAEDDNATAWGIEKQADMSPLGWSQGSFGGGSAEAGLAPDACPQHRVTGPKSANTSTTNLWEEI